MIVTIKRSWLNACGYRHIDETKTYPVVYVYPQRLPDGTRMFEIDFRGRLWTVAEWRCSAVQSEPFDVEH